MSEEEIIQEIEKLELEEEKEKTVKYLLKVVIEGKKHIIQEKEFFLKKKEKEIEKMREELQMYVDTDLIKEKLEKEIKKLKDKNKTLESLLQGNLYEMYLYYKELAGKYQANCISKDKIREIIYGNYENLEIILLIKELLEE